MKDFFNEWGILLAIAIIGIPIFLYVTNVNFANKINKAFDEKPYVSYKNDALYIDDFDFSIGMIGFNQVSGDFDKLDEKVYKSLYGKTGKCEVFMNSKNTDQYGNSTETYQSVGFIDIDELNRYQASSFWKKSGGLQKALSLTSDTSSLQSDNFLMDTVESPVKHAKTVTTDKPINGISTTQVSPGSTTFRFNSMIGMPWIYYKTEKEGLTELTLQDERLATSIDYWKTFVDDIEDIEATVYSDNATVKITTAQRKSSFTLKRSYANTFSLDGSPSIALDIISPTECMVYFLYDDNCVGVSNKSVL